MTKYFVLCIHLLASFASTINAQSSIQYTLVGDFLSRIVDLTSVQSNISPLYPDPEVDNQENGYDFVIVGSGPSGSALANRLTENPKVKVLILENGEEPSFISDIPLACGALEFSKYNYGYKSQPQPGFCKGCPNKSLQWPHGNVLGGSSVINYMIYVRGNPGDYDKWAALGNPGWSYKDLLPLFKKLEDARVEVQDKDYRGQGGPVTVSDVPFRTKIVNVYVNACMEAGHNYVDYNGKHQLGVSYIQSTTKNGRRCSAEKAYLRPIRHRKNIKIQTLSKVTKILIEKKTKRAYGVEYYHNNKKHVAYAKKEVILSAGALNSPQVLILSGIGPKEHLQELGIPVIKDLPVGKKMYDHASFPLISFQLNESIVLDLVSAILNPLSYAQLALGTGTFTSIGGVEAITYIRTNMSTDPDPLYPDVELMFTGLSLATDYGILFRKIFNVGPELYNKYFRLQEGKYIYLVTPVVLHPRSYGYIKLKSKDPFTSPLFYPNYFSDPENHDVKTLIAGIREFQRINKMPSLQRYGAKVFDIPLPGCEQEQFDSDSYWECTIRTIIGSYYHQVSTCKMGPASDKEAVVDNQLKVYGIKNLRVVDTSVMPITPSAHNVGPAYVIGERAAEIIKGFYKI